MDMSQIEGCLICYDSKGSLEIEQTGETLKNSLHYLHSALTKQDANGVRFENGNNYKARLCKHCFEATLALTKLNEQLSKLQREISDSTIAYSLSVLHRRSQTPTQNKENTTLNVQKKRIIELDVADLPSNIFENIDIENIIDVVEHTTTENVEEAVDVEIADNEYVTITSVEYPLVEVKYDGRITHLNYEQNPGIIDLTTDQDLIVTDPLQVDPLLITENNSSISNLPNLPSEEGTSDSLKTVKIVIEKLSLKTIKQYQHTNDVSSLSKSKSASFIPRQVNLRSQENKNTYKRVHVGSAKENKHHENGSKQSHVNQIIKTERPRRKHATGPYKCTKCPQIFPTTLKLAVHRRFHKGKCVYQCLSCSKVFPYWAYLKSHEVVHSREKLFQCKLCVKRFKYSHSLKVHERLHNRFQCSYCGKWLTELRHLRNHERIHTGEKFPCSSCNKSYVNLHSLRSHTRKHASKRV